MNRSSARRELLDLQAAVSRKLKDEMKRRMGADDPQIQRYYKIYKKEFSKIEKYSTKSELVEEVCSSDIVFCGDFHTLRQSQKTPIRILRDVLGRRSDIALGIEMVRSCDQHHLDDYMAGKIGEKAFLRRIDYYRTWGFNWHNYKELLDFCKKTSIRVAALNAHTGTSKSSSLDIRNMLASLNTAKTWLEMEGGLLFVLFGDLHLASPFLPGRTSKILKVLSKKPKITIIYQNSEKIYHKLASKGKELSVDVVKLGAGRYCVISSPPWIMYQSYLTWMDGGGELLTDFELEDEVVDDYYHHVLELVRTVSVYFDLPFDKLSDFSVLTPRDLEFIEIKKKTFKKNRVSTDELVELGSCILPEERLICLSDLSIVRASEKASQMAFFLCSGNRGMLSSPLGRDAASFYNRVYVEMIGYIGSKIINYKRKCDTIADYREFLRRYKGVRLSSHLRTFREVAKRMIAHDEMEKKVCALGDFSLFAKKLPSSFYKGEERVVLRFARALGHLIGEKVYLALMEGALRKEDVSRLFYLRFKDEMNAAREIFGIICRVRNVKLSMRRKRSFF